MPQLEKLKALAETLHDPIPPSWAFVFYLLIEHQSPGSGNPGVVVAASGEASFFSYGRNSIAPMYFCTIGGDQRLELCTGYRVTRLRTTDAEKAFSLIHEGIDASTGVFIAGPEAGLCYGYNNPGGVDAREIYGISDSFSGFVSKTTYVNSKMEQWIKADGEWIERTGWMLLAHFAMNDETKDDPFFERYLPVIERNIHTSKNRVKDAMNSALIAIGIRNDVLMPLALSAAQRIGKVHVDHGETSCKTPDAIPYIQKTVARKKAKQR